MKKIALALTILCLSFGTANAAVMRVSTSSTDANAGNSLSMQLDQTSSLFVWVSTAAGERITGLSLNVSSSDAAVAEATAHNIQNPNSRWFTTASGTLGDFVTDSNAFILFSETGISTGGEDNFVLHSEVQLLGTAIGTTNIRLSKGQFDVTDGANSLNPNFDTTASVSVSAVPEPGSLSLLGGLLAAGCLRRRRRA